jgi:hypothetical protein
MERPLAGDPSWGDRHGLGIGEDRLKIRRHAGRRGSQRDDDSSRRRALSGCDRTRPSLSPPTAAAALTRSFRLGGTRYEATYKSAACRRCPGA